MATRRDFLLGGAAAALPRLITTGIGGPAAAAENPAPREKGWDQGKVQHLIPTASHDPLDTSGTCGVGMVTAFLDHPRKDLDTSCVDDLTLDMSPDDESDTAGS